MITTGTLQKEAAETVIAERRRQASAHRAASTRSRRGSRTLLGALVVAAALIAPASALASGTVSTKADGEVTVEGSSDPDQVTVDVTPQTFPKATIVISGPGVTEGTDTANICTPSTDAVTCDIDYFDNLVLNGGDGADKITVNGEGARAKIIGDDGADELTGGDSPDQIQGGAQKDRIDGRGGDDYLDGQTGGDTVMGGDGNDTDIFDAGDNDRIDLGPGRDTFYTSNADGEDDTLIGGDGIDLILFTTYGASGEEPFSTIDLSKGVYSWDEFDTYSAGQRSVDGIEDVGSYFQSSGPDVLIGDAHANLLAGGGGNDQITGGPGADTIYGDGSFLGAGYLVGYGEGADTIDSFDGFEDRVDCGSGADTLTSDQFDASLLTDCETVDTRQANPFGIEPKPDPQPEPQPQPDVAAPHCTTPKPGAKKRRSFVKRGFSLAIACDEDARLDVVSRAHGLVLDSRSLDYATGGRKVAVKVPRALRRSLGKRFTVRVRIDATDHAGNRSTTFTSLKVR